MAATNCMETGTLGNSSELRHSQVQREMPWIGSTKEPVEVAIELVESCKDELMALNRCIDLSGLADETLSEALGIDAGHFSRIRKGRGHFPTRKRLRLMSLCGNILPLQFEAWKLGRRIREETGSEENQRLRMENERLRRSA